MLREVRGTQRLPRVLAFRVDGTGPAIDEGKFDAALVKNGTGDYTLTFKHPFARVPIVTVGVLSASLVHQISSVTQFAVRIKLKTVGGVATDGVLHTAVHGFDSLEQV